MASTESRVPLPVSLSLCSSQPHSLFVNVLSPTMHCIDRTTADSLAFNNYFKELLSVIHQLVNRSHLLLLSKVRASLSLPPGAASLRQRAIPPTLSCMIWSVCPSNPPPWDTQSQNAFSSDNWRVLWELSTLLAGNPVGCVWQIDTESYRISTSLREVLSVKIDQSLAFPQGAKKVTDM